MSTPSPPRSAADRYHELLADLIRDQLELEDQLREWAALRADLSTTDIAPAGGAPAAGPPLRRSRPPAKSLKRRLLSSLASRLRSLGALLRSVTEPRDWLTWIGRDDVPIPQFELGRDVFIAPGSDDPADLPVGLLGTALHTLAAEDLRFVELVGSATLDPGDPKLNVLLLREARTLEEALTEPLPKSRLLGKTIDLGSGPSKLVQAQSRFLRRIDDYWISAASPWGGKTHEMKTAVGPRVAGTASAIVLTTPLNSGLDLVVAELVGAARARGLTVILASLLDDRGAAHRLAGFAALGAEILPTSPFFAQEWRSVALAQRLTRAGVDRIIQIGPGSGFYTELELQDLINEIRLVDLPIPTFPARTIEIGRPRRPEIGLSLDPENPESPARAEKLASARVIEIGWPAAGVLPLPRLAARRDFGLDPDRLVVLAAADLVAESRFEDLCWAANEFPDLEFLIVGRGPFYDRLIELETYLSLTNLRILRAADPFCAVSAADIFCSTAERLWRNYTLDLAQQAGLPVLARRCGVLAAADETQGLLAFTDLNGLKEGLERLRDPACRARLGAGGKEAAAVRRRDSAWLDALFGP